LHAATWRIETYSDSAIYLITSVLLLIVYYHHQQRYCFCRGIGDCLSVQETYDSLTSLTDLAAYRRYVVQASATNYFVDQWHEAPARGPVFMFSTSPGR